MMEPFNDVGFGDSRQLLLENEDLEKPDLKRLKTGNNPAG
jgi:hypothetical protein